jgi:NAD(P)-dependent dehydrogenase (short-subunit alcohol dehydrogenase family)
VSERRALVLGGSGHLGSEVLRGLHRAGVPTSFTFHSNEARARALADELGAQPFRSDLRKPDSIHALFDALEAVRLLPSVLVHTAGIARTEKLQAITAEIWDELFAVNVRSALLACQELARRRFEPTEVVFTAALDGIHPVPGPAHFAAAQAALLGMTRALAKELGPRTRVNLVVLGVLDGGVSAQLEPKLLADYKKFTALGRTGTAAEAARAVLWLALENTLMSGATLTVSGGL